MNKRFKKGFTLVELVVVIAIIAVLSAIMIPSLTGYVKRAKISADEQEARAIYDIYKTYVIEIENGQTNEKFPDYYATITGKILDNAVFYTGEVENLTMQDFVSSNVATFMIYEGNYYLLFDISLGEVRENGASVAIRNTWIGS